MGKGLIGRLRDRLAIALPDEAEAPVAPLVDRILRVGLALALAGVIVQSVADVLNQLLPETPYRAFDVDEDTGIFAWPTITATFTAGVAALLLRLLHPRWQLTFLAIAFAFLSFDDYFGMHERVGRLDEKLGLPEEWNLRYLWALVFLPMFGLAAAMLWFLAERTSGRTSAFLRWGVGLLGLALVLETLSPILLAFWSEEGWQSRIEILVEEDAELVGWILIATALTAVTCRAIAGARRPRLGA